MPNTLSYRALASLEDVQEALQITTDDGWDNLLTRLINSASNEIFLFTNREFVSMVAYGEGENETRRFDHELYGVGRQVTQVGDMQSVPESVEIHDWNGNLVSAPSVDTDVDCFPMIRQPFEPIERLRFRNGHSLAPYYYVLVTSRWGFPELPEDVRNACIETVRLWFDQIGHRSATNEADLNPATPMRNLPPHVFVSLDKYRRPNV